ncbi:MAG: hypothetical protein JW984_15325 [Deltaproteobacteria bacterium]|uniref:DAGKc domain-containing protein n=1 Tax=Candidatus Zymogenus saltonus TaxID=2844893 RepID=A0A9D8KHF7_9DELT|nr:hypothetical protein [Candidatus Zymogenus saltonus]
MAEAGHKIAVILNGNASRVNNQVVKRLVSIVGGENLYYTRALDEVDGAVADILKKDYDIIFSGGGDGTIVGVVTAVVDVSGKMADSGVNISVPTIGILKMGTGNAWAWATGVNNGLKQIEEIKKGGGYSVTTFDLLKVKGRLCPFAGIGIDAQVLNDYYDLMEKLSQSFLERFFVGLNGYIYSSVTRSIPAVRAMTRGGKAPEVEVRFTGDKTFRLNRNGHYEALEDVMDQEVFRGRANIVACGTIPYFGYAFRAFPLAEAMSGTMHLRIANVRPAEALRNIPRLWRGTYNGPEFTDFLTDAVNIKFDREMPLEVGGDPHGYTSEVDFEVPEFRVSVISYKEKESYWEPSVK